MKGTSYIGELIFFGMLDREVIFAFDKWMFQLDSSSLFINQCKEIKVYLPAQNDGKGWFKIWLVKTWKRAKKKVI